MATDLGNIHLGITSMPGPDGSNEMEMAILKYGQLQIDLEKSQAALGTKDHTIRDQERTIIRLSDQIDMLRHDLASATRQRNFFMEKFTRLAVQVDAIGDAAAGFSAMIDRQVHLAKVTAQTVSETTKDPVVEARSQEETMPPEPPEDDDGAAEMGRRFGASNSSHPLLRKF